MAIPKLAAQSSNRGHELRKRFDGAWYRDPEGTCGGPKRCRKCFARLRRLTVQLTGARKGQ